MAGKIPTAAELDLLTNLKTNALAGCKMGLFASNLTISSTTTLADCTGAEATFTGYSRATLSTWSAPSIDGTGAAVSTNTQGTFTPTGSGGSGNIYGYFLTDSTGTKFYGAESFTGGPLSEAQNVSLEVDVTFSLINRF
jgi:hypothetical protein